MCSANRASKIVRPWWLLLLVASCTSGVPLEKSSAPKRAIRRAFDGAPPVIPHENIGAACTSCHSDAGIEVKGLGFAPPSPHAKTSGLSDRSRCRQCHVFRRTEGVFRKSRFVGLPQNLRSGARLYSTGPPVIPHDVLMRENCAACHTGKAARAEILTPHPERRHCQQCHVPQIRSAGLFAREQP